MKTIIIFLFLTCFWGIVVSQELTIPPNGNNEKAEVSQWIGLVKITITYHSPDVHGPSGLDRKGHIWGELVHYGFIDQGFGPSTTGPWRAGANESTSISFSHDIMIDGKEVKAGAYALFLDVERNGPWYWILSTNLGWGSFQYDPKYDVIRIPSIPEEAPYTEWLTYGFDDRLPSSVTAFLQWESKRVSFKIDVPNVNDLYVEQMRKELLAWPGFNYQNWQTAAAFCAQNKINLEEALVWADRAIREPFRGATFGKEDFSTFQTKSAVLSALGRNEEADRIMDKAIHTDGATSFQIFLYNRNLLAGGRNDKALEVAKYNQLVHPEEKFWTNLALGRSYAAIHDMKNGIKKLELAIQNIPENQRQRLPVFQDELKKMQTHP